MKKQPKVYVIGSLRNKKVPVLANRIRKLGYDVFDDWHAAGCYFCKHSADESWQKYEKKRGHKYPEALRGHAASHVFNFDKYHLDDSDIAVLYLPAGKAGHMESGYIRGFTEGVLRVCDQLGEYLRKKMEKSAGQATNVVNAAVLQTLSGVLKELKKMKVENKKRLYILHNDPDRWDIMYLFADGVFPNFKALKAELLKIKDQF